MDLVVNPAAGGGRAGRLLGEMSRELERAGFSVNVHRTGGRQHLYETVQRLVREGVEAIGVMGGDGTFHDAANALLLPDATVLDASRTVFAALPVGTGGDLGQRTLRMPGTPCAIADALAGAVEVPFDLGRLEYGAEGQRAVTLFTNIASCGISGRVDALVVKGPKWLSGKASYLFGTVRAIAGWRHARMTVRVDGALLYDGKAMVVAVCNGRAFGGGMVVSPGSDATDGVLDVVVLGDLSLADVVKLTPRFYDGTHLAMERVYSAKGTRVEIDAPDTDVQLDVDGETPGSIPGVFTVIPGALRVLRPK